MQKAAMLAAIEKALREGLAVGGGTWSADAEGEEIEFRICEGGIIFVTQSNEETGEETEHSFEVLVREIS
jgi:hypothetical protein